MISYDDFVEKVQYSITDKLFNKTEVSSNSYSTDYLEQYKLHIDSTNKADERRGTINNFFITINGIFVPFLIKTFPLGVEDKSQLVVLSLLVAVGIVVSLEWLFVMNLYRRLNYINYSIVKEIEKNLPCHIFSVKSDILARHTKLEKANVFVDRESAIPKLFCGIYVVYLFISILAIVIKL